MTRKKTIAAIKKIISEMELFVKASSDGVQLNTEEERLRQGFTIFTSKCPLYALRGSLRRNLTHCYVGGVFSIGLVPRRLIFWKMLLEAYRLHPTKSFHSISFMVDEIVVEMSELNDI
ncbi:MAG: hypothetical protein JXB49_05280 [Bacteroidales bacterium]|nr:hypothetical protein [Bacteroidales bacterium]